ncbi:MAG TPA: hypothetical protein IAA13_05745 [Candidatus Alistipes merdigallinarum]|nr:hypothetical protein [Candidatus Alistipes merdigallinarum]
MKKSLAITLNLSAWILLIAYLSFALPYTNRQKKERLCKGINVTILDSAERKFITPAMVKMWFETKKIKLVGEKLMSINTIDLEQFIGRRGYVRTVRVYTSMDGLLNIEITQRQPIARFNTQNGYNFYVTEDNYILPAQRHFVTYVPIITGYILPPFRRDYIGPLDRFADDKEKKIEKNYLFLTKLINFVKFVDSNDFWRSFIVQIHVEGTETELKYDPDIEIVPRVGNQVILLGGIDGYQEKLDKLLVFYKNAVAYEGWEKFKYINLKYKDQVVCIENK